MRFRTTAMTVLGFAGLMPPLGSLTVVIYAALSGAAQTEHLVKDLKGYFVVFLFGIPVAFIIALIPSLACGAVVALLARRRPGIFLGAVWKRISVCGSIGLLTCGIYFFLLCHLLPTPSRGNPVAAALTIGVVGGVSAALVGCLLPRPSWLRSFADSREAVDNG